MPMPRLEKPIDTIVSSYGRKEATIFTGFCGKHDKELFAPIEDCVFDNSLHHVFLYTYRYFAQVYHKRQEEINSLNIADSQLPYMSSDLYNMQRGFVQSIKDLEVVKQKCDEAIIEKNYDIFQCVVWEFDLAVRFACSGMFTPTHDFRGKFLKDLTNLSKLAKHVFMIVFPEGDKTFCIFSWLKENNSFFSNLYKQLLRLEIQERKNLINNGAPLFCENFAFNPNYWNSWNDNQKEYFMKNVVEFGNIISLQNRTCETNYDLFNCTDIK